MNTFVISVLVGTAIAIMLSLFRGKNHGYSLIRTTIATLIFIFLAAIGGMIVGAIESGSFGSNSLYGCIFVTPISIAVYSLITKDNYSRLLDFYIPPICIMMASLRVNCLLTGCCYGRILFERADGTGVRFPNQVAEIIVAIVIMIVFLYLEKKDIFTGNHYAIFLITYGTLRFILNCFRAELTPFVWYLPAGHFWSLVSVLIGLLWLIINNKDYNSETDT